MRETEGKQMRVSLFLYACVCVLADSQELPSWAKCVSALTSTGEHLPHMDCIDRTCTYPQLLVATEAEAHCGGSAWENASDTAGARVLPMLTHEFANTVFERKWILFVGDSTVRMLFDYSVGFVSGSWAKFWPQCGPNNTMTQHPTGSGKACGKDRDEYPEFDHNGPDSHAHNCKKIDGDCVFEAWLSQGVRMTMVWLDHASAPNGLRNLERVLGEQTIGRPAAVLVGNGAWELFKFPQANATGLSTGTFGKHQLDLLDTLDQLLEDNGQKAGYPVQRNSMQVHMALRESWSKVMEENAPMKVWLGLQACGEGPHYHGPDLDWYLAEGTALRTRPGWAYFDRHQYMEGASTKGVAAWKARPLAHMQHRSCPESHFHVFADLLQTQLAIITRALAARDAERGPSV